MLSLNVPSFRYLHRRIPSEKLISWHMVYLFVNMEIGDKIGYRFSPVVQMKAANNLLNLPQPVSCLDISLFALSL